MTTKRPKVLDLDSLMVKPKQPAAKAPDAPKPLAPKFRTSVYFDRTVHDRLRDIAHAERKTIADLINEGLDHVLTSRSYPTTAALQGKD